VKESTIIFFWFAVTIIWRLMAMDLKTLKISKNMRFFALFISAIIILFGWNTEINYFFFF